MKTNLISKPDRNSRIQYALKKLEGVVPFGAAELSIAAKWFGRQILVGHQYQPVSKLAGVPIVLVKATVGRQAAEVLGNDYGLSEVNHRPIIITILSIFIAISHIIITITPILITMRPIVTIITIGSIVIDLLLHLLLLDLLLLTYCYNYYYWIYCYYT